MNWYDYIFFGLNLSFNCILHSYYDISEVFLYDCAARLPFSSVSSEKKRKLSGASHDSQPAAKKPNAPKPLM